MLHSLKVRNVALIEELNIHFSEGLNVLTGETGAGKSILVDSLGVILGDRVSSDLIRHDQEELKVEGVFSISPESNLTEKLSELDIPVEDDGTIILARKVTRAGKNTVWANGCQIPVSLLKNLGQNLVQVHAQHDTQELFSSSYALSTLDGVHKEIEQQKKRYQERYSRWKALEEEKRMMEEEQVGRLERLEIISWQIQELTEANLDIEEEKALSEYILIASNAGRISEGMAEAYRYLNQDDLSVLALLSKATREVLSASKYDKNLERIAQELQENYYRIEEASYEVRDRQSSLEFDPIQFEQKQKRMEILHQLQKKYGLNLEELVKKLNDLVEEKERLESFQNRSEEIDRKIAAAFIEVKNEGQILSEVRKIHGKQWEQKVEQSIKELAMPEARFVLDIRSVDRWSSQGQDEVDFLFSANVGQPPQSMKKVASGGELSRVALAIQAISISQKSEKTMIFDEIDTGIGGQTALAVGKKMRILSQKNQILSITHLPQIAVFAEKQLMIEKRVQDGQTYTYVKELAKDEQISELARMLSGENNNQLAQEAAAAMLKQAMNDIREK